MFILFFFFFKLSNKLPKLFLFDWIFSLLLCHIMERQQIFQIMIIVFQPKNKHTYTYIYIYIHMKFPSCYLHHTLIHCKPCQTQTNFNVNPQGLFWTLRT